MEFGIEDLRKRGAKRECLRPSGRKTGHRRKKQVLDLPPDHPAAPSVMDLQHTHFRKVQLTTTGFR